MLLSLLAVVFDALSVFSGFLLATWIRFDSGWLAIRHQPPERLYTQYAWAAALVTLLFLAVFRSRGLFVRPQTGSFVTKIPRLIKAATTGIVFTTVLAFALINEFDFSRLVIGIGYFCILVFVLLERWILFRIEWNLARHSHHKNSVLILGTDSVATHVTRTLKREPMLRSQVVGYLRTDLSEPDPDITGEQIIGGVGELEQIVAARDIDQIILTNASLKHDDIVEIIMLCERHLITFNMVPDLFRLLTTSMDVQSLDDIPLLGIGQWPLDVLWSRILKRIEDILGAAIGLILASPVIALAAILIKRSSPGPVFYVQERCGEKGQVFKLYKLRTMAVDAEKESGPVFTSAEDARRTPVGAWLRRYNIDELPQLWNVLCGDMTLVGPRPERPHFVEQFKTDIARYMWRHVSKPGMTGWAQVNGFRGDTSITERVKYDLYYLENWSLAFDFKILLRTLFARENAY